MSDDETAAGGQKDQLNLQRLQNSRRAHRGVSTKLQNSARNLTDIPIATISEQQIAELKVTKTKLLSKLEDLKAKNSAIEMLIDNADELDADMAECDDHESKLLLVVQNIDDKLAAKDAHDNRLAQTTPRTNLANNASANALKLPKFELPSFSGEYSSWTSFYDLFNSSVDSSTQLSNAQKLHYLRSSLKGEAASLIATLSITDDNYATARAVLENRFANKRAIVRSHLHSVFHASAVKPECAHSLRKLIEGVEENRLALLQQDVQMCDAVLVFSITEKMDASCRKEWEIHSTGQEVQKYKDIKDFLEKRCRALEAATGSESSKSGPSSSKAKDRKMTNFGSKQRDACPACQGSHSIYTCNKFKGLDVDQRRALASSCGLCFNCLRSGHGAKECPSKSTCHDCNGRHHTSLHKAKTGQTEKLAQEKQGDETKGAQASQANLSGCCSHRAANPVSQVILGTCFVPIRTPNGTRKVRALLDSGSEITLLSQDLVKSLGITLERSKTVIGGIGGHESVSSGCFQLEIPTADSGVLKTRCHVMPKLANALPSQEVASFDASLLKGYKLADSTFNKPGTVSLIIGGDLYDSIVLGTRERVNDNLFLRETLFGWMVTGSIHAAGVNSRQTSQSFRVSTVNSDTLLKRFWELEEAHSEQPLLSKEEQQCEDFFKQTTTRDALGRFSVKLPFKPAAEPLGNSLDQARRRYLSLERRLDEDTKSRYAAFIQEFLDLGHMEKVPANEVHKPAQLCFYLPHHCVEKQSSTTTKLRVVFDGSAKTTSGASLNDSLMVGPKTQDNLLDIILRFRFFPIVLSADIEKMYRQVALQQPDKDFHRLLWRNNSTEDIGHYRMTRVTYGIASSAHHATRALQQVALNNPTSKAALVIERDMYVDDLMSGADTIHEAIELQDELMRILGDSGFPLRKWGSNSLELIERLRPELREMDPKSLDDDKFFIKTLGLRWLPKEDSFAFQVSPLPDDVKFTKRMLLSDASKLFDPIGLLCPVILKFKILMQTTWTGGSQWDEKLPDGTIHEWMEIRQSLPSLEYLRIPRRIFDGHDVPNFELHVFTDASELAYGAAVYIRSVSKNGSIASRLLTAKSKVAPVKAITIPRLELCGALLGAKLLKGVTTAVSRTKYNFQRCVAWTDSTIVLCWLRSPPRDYQCFVANRVTQIQDIVPPDQWRHIRTNQNPADFVSRGMSSTEILDCDLWWKGPQWLSESEELWPEQIHLHCDAPERRSKKVALKGSVQQRLVDLSRFSNYQRLIRSFALVLRFIQRLRNPDKPSTGPLVAKEIEASRLKISKMVQLEQFPSLFETLKSSKELPRNDHFRSLCPFYDDEDDVIRVGGRLSQCDLDYNFKHPILLDTNGHFQVLVIRDAHKRTLHGGPTATSAAIRQQYWIRSGRNLIRSVIQQCVKCLRFSGKPMQPMMGDLPQERIQASRPFTFTGLDFGGPFTIKVSQKKHEKAYLALFVCFATKATHLETVSSLKKEACIAALRRFTSRRGIPQRMFSDNGTNFTGARNELSELGDLLSSQASRDSITAFASSHGMEWVTIPPRTPHFGGLWEAGIKSAKKHLRRIMGITPLTFEELSTLFTQIEAQLNSRPICQLSEDTNDSSALTPGHFLVGGPINSLPDKSIDEAGITPFRRWHLVQKLQQDFWRRWHAEYLTQLQQRPKWKEKTRNLQKGDLVLLKDNNLQPLQWPTARVSKIFSGNDGQIRVVEIKTTKGTFIRPSHKLILLLPENSAKQKSTIQ